MCEMRFEFSKMNQMDKIKSNQSKRNDNGSNIYIYTITIGFHNALVGILTRIEIIS